MSRWHYLPQRLCQSSHCGTLWWSFWNYLDSHGSWASYRGFPCPQCRILFEELTNTMYTVSDDAVLWLFPAVVSEWISYHLSIFQHGSHIHFQGHSEMTFNPFWRNLAGIFPAIDRKDMPWWFFTVCSIPLPTFVDSDDECVLVVLWELFIVPACNRKH